MNKRQKKKIRKKYTFIMQASILKNCKITSINGLSVPKDALSGYEGPDILYVVTRHGGYKEYRERKMERRHKRNGRRYNEQKADKETV